MFTYSENKDFKVTKITLCGVEVSSKFEEKYQEALYEVQDRVFNNIYSEWVEESKFSEEHGEDICKLWCDNEWYTYEKISSDILWSDEFKAQSEKAVLQFLIEKLNNEMK